MVGLDKLPSRDLAIRNRIMALSLTHLREELGKTARNYRINSAIADEVATECEDRVARIEQDVEQTDRISAEELPGIGLGALTNQEREIYLGQFSEGLISAAITRTLITRVVDELEDGLKTGEVAGYREAVERSLGFHPVFRFCVMLHRRFGLTGPLAAQLAYRFEMLRAVQATVHELIDYNHETIAALFGESTARELDELLRWRFDRTWQSLDRLRTRYPEYAETVQKRHLGRVALRLEDHNYRRMLQDHVLSPELFNRLEHDLDKRARVLDRQPRLDLALEPAALVAKVPYFAELDERRIGMIVRALKPHLTFPGERILRKGEVGNAMYFIASGTVEVATSPKPTRLESGDFFGAIALITGEPRKADAVAVDYCHLLVLGLRDFKRVLDAHPNLREIVHRTAQERLGTWFGKK
jgi:CPA1 family monovalent cation:H+ antiporter